MSKTINVFFFPSHGTVDRVSGVDWARVIQPGKLLNGFKYRGYTFKTRIYDPKEDEQTVERFDWITVAKDYDLTFFNYTALPWAFAAMGAFNRKYGRKMIMDLDDSLWDINKDNPAYNAYHPGAQGIKDFNAICAEVDAMTTTSSFLKNIITHNTLKRHKQIRVIPNYIDLSLYKHRSSFKNDGQIQLLHFGSTTHFLDLENEEYAKGIDMIMKEYPNVTLKTVGALLPKYKWRWGQRYENAFGHQDVLHWIQDPDKFPKFMDECDIMTVPLRWNTYNKAKSSIKFLEASSAGKPGVWEDIRQYEEVVRNGENGFLANTTEDWHKSIKKLIDDVELRRNMGQKAFETIQKDWQIQDHLQDYAQVILDTLGK